MIEIIVTICLIYIGFLHLKISQYKRFVAFYEKQMCSAMNNQLLRTGYRVKYHD